MYLGLFAGVGGCFFDNWIAQRGRVSRSNIVFLLIGLPSAVLSLGLQGLDLLGLNLSDLVSALPWQAALATSLGPSLLLVTAAMVAGLAVPVVGAGGLSRALSAAGLVVVGLSLAASGHAASASPQWLTRPAVFIHVIAVAFWIGALMPLLAMVRGPTRGLLFTIDRFSRASMPIVGVLVLMGAFLAVVQVENIHALIATRYGLILLAKLSLVIVLLGFAALNRFYLVPRLDAGSSNTGPLVRSIATECLVALAILAVVAGWRFTPPPRALAAAVRPPLAIHIHTEHAMFQVLVSPGVAGIDNFVLQLMAGDASPLPAKEATLTLSLPERGIEPFERPASLEADGYWHVHGVSLPFAGHWHVRIEALVSDFEKVTLEDELNVPAH